MAVFVRFFGFCLLLSLYGCSGGGGGSGSSSPPMPPAAPILTVTSGLKTLQFSWATVSGADYYRLFERATAGSGYLQLGSDLAGVTSYSLDVAVHKVDWVGARYILQACNSAGCSPDSTAVGVLSSVLDTIGYVKATSRTVGDTFGYSVAISADGRTLAVGAPAEDGEGAGPGGTAITDCDRDGNPSVYNDPDPGASDPALAPCRNAGAVFVYALSNSGWELESYIKAPDAQNRDHFGETVSLSGDGNVLAVGAPLEDGLGDAITDSGSIYVYNRISGVWSLAADGHLRASWPVSSPVPSFGTAVALNQSGTMLAAGFYEDASAGRGIVGSPVDDCGGAAPINCAPHSGAVYVFSHSGGSWSATPTFIKAGDAREGDRFGYSVAFSGDGTLLAVGAILQANGDGTQRGAVYVLDTGSWSEQQVLSVADAVVDSGDRFGVAVSLSGNGDTIAVGANGEDSRAPSDGTDNNGPNSGAVYIFNRSGGGPWIQQAYLKASNVGAEDNFGSVVALSNDGNTLAVGAPFEQSSSVMAAGDGNDDTVIGAGAVYVYARSGSAWSQVNYVKAPNTADVTDAVEFLSPSADSFGSALALSGDGNTLAIGARYEDGASLGISTNPNPADNGAQNAGAVYLY